MYAVIKEILRLQGGPDIGSVRAPLLELAGSDQPIIAEAHEMIKTAIKVLLNRSPLTTAPPPEKTEGLLDNKGTT